jgi:cytochrome P450
MTGLARARKRNVEALLARAHPQIAVHPDPRTHTRHRQIIMHAFQPRRLGAMEPIVRARAEDLIDASASTGECDIVSELAPPLSVAARSRGFAVADTHEYAISEWRRIST